MRNKDLQDKLAEYDDEADIAISVDGWGTNQLRLKQDQFTGDVFITERIGDE